MNRIIQNTIALDGELVIHRQSLHNNTNKPASFNGAGYSCAKIELANVSCLAFRSEWGREFTPQWHCLCDLQVPLTIASRNGRSSHGYSPFIYFTSQSGFAMALAVCHSGNWSIKVLPTGEIIFLMEAEYFSGELQPDERLALPQILVAKGESGLFELCAKTRQWLEKNWFSTNRVAPGCFEWNHWWTYEDIDITQDIFLQNVHTAAALGVTLCTLDAGWFGIADGESHWTQCRGDWDIVNEKRFPNGLRYLADEVHKEGMQFGIWIEAEALGTASQLMQCHPEWAAQNSECAEPYLCLGASGAADWLYNTLCRLVNATGCDWIKLDFNVDPQSGCHCATHGHEAGMGLYRHYQSLYTILQRLRAAYPALIIENCSSGGLRFDLEIMRYTDVSFLSDPDETAHSLQCFWGASLLVAPHRLLHWSHSQTRLYPDKSHVFPSFEIDEHTAASHILASLRCSWLHSAGFCRQLYTLSESTKQLFKEQIAFYKAEIAPLLYNGVLVHLTAQPLRNAPRQNDERQTLLAPAGFEPMDYAAFCLKGIEKAYVFVFALNDACDCTITVSGFIPFATYAIQNCDTAVTQYQTAENGAISICTDCNQGESRLYLVTWLNADM